MTLISAQALFDGLPDPSLRIVDARFALADPPQGLKDYLRSHVPGARHVDLDGDLSGPKTDLQQGRHPLPSDAQFSALLERLGFGKVLRGASGKLAGTLAWDGSPLALDLPSLGGQLALERGRSFSLQEVGAEMERLWGLFSF